MTTYLTIIAITIIGGFLLMVLKPELRGIEDKLSKFTMVSFIGVLICILLMFFDLRLKGRFTTSIIGLSFLISTILLFAITKKNKRKLLTGIITIPTAIIGLLSLIWESVLLFLLIPYLMFQAPILKSKIDKTHNVEVRNGGFMACGESLYVTSSKFGIFDKQIHVGNNACVKGINKIETTTFNDKKYEFLIHHDGKFKEENPYKYKIERENENER